jgi:hypothetical protein
VVAPLPLETHRNRNATRTIAEAAAATLATATGIRTPFVDHMFQAGPRQTLDFFRAQLQWMRRTKRWALGYDNRLMCLRTELLRNGLLRSTHLRNGLLRIRFTWLGNARPIGQAESEQEKERSAKHEAMKVQQVLNLREFRTLSRGYCCICAMSDIPS